jgi:hypothetical protein
MNLRSSSVPYTRLPLNVIFSLLISSGISMSVEHSTLE